MEKQNSAKSYMKSLNNLVFIAFHSLRIWLLKAKKTILYDLSILKWAGPLRQLGRLLFLFFAIPVIFVLSALFYMVVIPRLGILTIPCILIGAMPIISEFWKARKRARKLQIPYYRYVNRYGETTSIQWYADLQFLFDIFFILIFGTIFTPLAYLVMWQNVKIWQKYFNRAESPHELYKSDNPIVADSEQKNKNDNHSWRIPTIVELEQQSFEEKNKMAILQYYLETFDRTGLKSLFAHGISVDTRIARKPILHWSVIKMDPDLVIFLIANGADVNASDEKGFSIIASTFELISKTDGSDNHCKIIDTLLEIGADANAISPYGNPLLFDAVRANNLQIVEILLKYGANPNNQSKGGLTPLLWNARNQRNELIATALLKGCAEANVEDPSDYQE